MNASNLFFQILLANLISINCKQNSVSNKSKLIQDLIYQLNNEEHHYTKDSLEKAILLLSRDHKQQKTKLPKFPIVINTWAFTNATAKAWTNLERYDNAVAAVVNGCSECEEERCDGTVGFGGSPDESAETTLDALIMNGKTHDAGSVAGLKRIKSAAAVAEAVMTFTKHTLLVGESATQFAIEMGFTQEDLHAKESLDKWTSWFEAKCQPNFRINVSPDPNESCGPYRPLETRMQSVGQKRYNRHTSEKDHDTIGIIAIDSRGDMAGGTSTNGATHKIPGRVGDSPIIGSGVYVDNDVGGAAGTGDGDTMMKFLPAYQAVESMRNGMSPTNAASDAIQRIAKYYANFVGAIIAIDKYGNHGAACHGLASFPYSVKNSAMSEVQVIHVACI